MKIDHNTHPMFMQFADWLAAITEEKQTPEDVLWSYTYLATSDMYETYTIKDWAEILYDGVPRPTVDDAEAWLLDTVLTIGGWNEFYEWAERTLFN